MPRSIGAFEWAQLKWAVKLFDSPVGAGPDVFPGTPPVTLSASPFGMAFGGMHGDGRAEAFFWSGGHNSNTRAGPYIYDAVARTWRLEWSHSAAHEDFVRAIADATNASPVVVTVANHGLPTGTFVHIYSAVGNTAINTLTGPGGSAIRSPWEITAIDANSFSLNGSSGNGAYVGGGVMDAAFPFTGGAAASLLSKTSTLPGNARSIMNIHTYQQIALIRAGCPVAPPELQAFDWWLLDLNGYGPMAWRSGVQSSLRWLGGPHSLPPYSTEVKSGGDIASKLLLPYSPLVGKILRILRGGNFDGVYEFQATAWVRTGPSPDPNWDYIWATEFLPQWGEYLVLGVGGSLSRLFFWRYNPFTGTFVQLAGWREFFGDPNNVGHVIFDSDRGMLVHLQPRLGIWQERDLLNADGTPSYDASAWRTLTLSGGPNPATTFNTPAAGPHLAYMSNVKSYVYLHNSDGGGFQGPPTSTWEVRYGQGAAVNPPVVQSITPNAGVLGQALTGVQIGGSNFHASAQVSLGAGITVSAVQVLSPVLISCTLTISAQASLGTRTVTVTNPDAPGTLPNAFTVQNAATVLRNVPTGLSLQVTGA